MNTFSIHPSAINKITFNMAAAAINAPRNLAGSLLEIRRPVNP